MSFEKKISENIGGGTLETPNYRIETNKDSFSSSAIKEFLSEYPSKFFDNEGVRSHYIDSKGGRNHRTILCLHSRYGWAYSFRKILPALLSNGFRVLAVDLIGFGLSSKDTDSSTLSTFAQCNQIKALLSHLNITDLTIVAHEMSCSVASQLPFMLPTEIEALVLVNPGLPVKEEGWSGLHMWRTLLNSKLDNNISAELRGCYPSLTPSELGAYCEPLAAHNGLVGVRHFHSNVVLSPTDPDRTFMEHGYKWIKKNWGGNISILTGSDDPKFDRSISKSLAKHLGLKRGVMNVDSVGGLPFEERPEVIKTIIDAFYTVW